MVVDRIKVWLLGGWKWVKQDPLTALFCIVFVVAWTLNAVKIASFAISELNGMYATVKGSELVKHWTDSTKNSPLGQPPER